ncbi:MAG: ribosome biogenesis GTPase Der [Deltaproteobacteria bacterium]|nr:MAG: ribosome biogenesis GTPase Der [Deltaproteobacteria bacterium]
MPRELPLVAIVGRPNVGKSTLFNRLVGGRPALVDDTPGVTRDRRYGEVEYFGARFRAVDTGGLDPDAEATALGAGIHRQARAAIDEADAVLFVVDGRAGLTPVDADLADMLRRCERPVVVAVNKIDGPKHDPLLAEFFALGLGEVFGVSAAHGRGVDPLVEAVVAAVPAAAARADDADEQAASGGDDVADPDEGRPLRIAFVGKPNVGKSSTVNRLVGAERALVHDAPGTTTDPVDTPFEFDGRPYVLVDTAGMRKRARIDARTEQVSVSMALDQIRRADVAVLVIDATEGPTEQDQRIAGAIVDAGRPVVIALNKADRLGPGDAARVDAALRDELHFLSFAPRVKTSALRGDGMADLLAAVDRVAAAHRARVPTAEINRFFAEVCETHPPPTQSGRSVRIHYMTQGGTRPPTFLLWANHPRYVAESYKRFLVNQLRRRYGFEGTPVRIVVKRKKRRERGGRA